MNSYPGQFLSWTQEALEALSALRAGVDRWDERVSTSRLSEDTRFTYVIALHAGYRDSSEIMKDIADEIERLSPLKRSLPYRLPGYDGIGMIYLLRNSH